MLSEVSLIIEECVIYGLDKLNYYHNKLHEVNFYRIAVSPVRVESSAVFAD